MKQRLLILGYGEMGHAMEFLLEELGAHLEHGPAGESQKVRMSL